MRGRRAVPAPEVGPDRLADGGHIRGQAPLPETADEVCTIARGMGADLDADVRLGRAATEAALKALSGNGQLAQYRSIAFDARRNERGDRRQQ